MADPRKLIAAAIAAAAPPTPAAELERQAAAAAQARAAARRAAPRAPKASMAGGAAARPIPAPASSLPPPQRAAADPPAAGAPVDDGEMADASSQPGGWSEASEPAAPQGGARRKRRAKGRSDGDPLDLQLAFYPQTDLGNAERFRERFAGRLLWCPEIGWLWWDGRRWALPGADEKVRIAAQQTVRAIQEEAAALVGTRHDFEARAAEKKREAMMFSDFLSAWGRTSEQATKIASIEKNAAPHLCIEPKDLDSDPFKINVLNGTLVIDRAAPGYVTLKAHDPADHITKLAPVTYDPDVACPLYDAFLEFVQPEVPMRRFLHQWLGLSLTGDATEQLLAVFWGKGKNGKSTLLETCAHVAGDYSETVPIETFLDQGKGRNAGQATPDLAILPGVRFLHTSEPDKGAKLSEALIKLATGGEKIQARHLNRDYFKFLPQFKLTISGNYRPGITGTDEGIWRRVQLIPWRVEVPKERRDKDLPKKLRAEASGIFNRLLDGLRDWLDGGLTPPESVLEATADYRRDSDPLGRFMEACMLVPSPGDRVQASVLHAVFEAWAVADGAAKWSAKGLANALKERGFESKHSDVNWWVNVKLTKTINDFVDHDGRPLRMDRPKTAPEPDVDTRDMEF